MRVGLLGEDNLLISQSRGSLSEEGRHGQEVWEVVQTKLSGDQWDLIDLHRGVIGGARRACVSSSETESPPGITQTSASGVDREWPQEYKVSSPFYRVDSGLQSSLSPAEGVPGRLTIGRLSRVPYNSTPQGESFMISFSQWL